MKTLILASMFAVLFSTGIAFAQYSGSVNVATDSESTFYRSLLDDGIKHGFPGYILGVKRKEKPPWMGAAGKSDIERNIDMRINDRFHVASITKIFTATAVLQLIDQGKLSLDTKITSLLDKKLLKPIPFIDEITVAQLLDHSSGIYGFNNDKDYIGTLIGSRVKDNVKWTPEEFVALAYGNRVKPFGKPGTGNYYGDTNYALLGMIIEKVTGKRLRNVVSKTIFEPIKMDNTGYYGEAELPERFELPVTTQGYLKRSKIVDSFVKLDSSFKVAKGNLYNTTTSAEKIDATARIVSTVEDLLKFGQALYGGKLLSEEGLKWLMSAAHKLENNKIGEHRQSVTSIYKTSFGVLFTSEGNGPSGTHAILAYHPETRSFVIAFTNIFGIFDEHDFIRGQIIDKIIRKIKHDEVKNRKNAVLLNLLGT